MFVTLQDLGSDDLFDVCIVGTGPAGLSCALRIAESGKRVILLEAGGLDYSDRSQSVYESGPQDDASFDIKHSRLRYFGGTSGHWQGVCRTLDPIDFRTKHDLEVTRWPIAKADLDPFLNRASSILELSEIPPDKIVEGSGLKSIKMVQSPPVRFGDKYSGTVKDHQRLFLCLAANLISLETDGNSITGANVSDYEGRRTSIRANTYVLACGAIENIRVLLWSNEVTNSQVVKSPESLGKYWMTHYKYTMGDAILTDRSALDLDELGQASYSPTEETIFSKRILNFRIFLEPQPYEATKKLIADIACIAPDWARWAAKLADKMIACGVKVGLASEFEPVARNRVELTGENDRFGVPRPRLIWEKTETDWRTIQASGRILGEYLAETDLGRLRLDDWVMDRLPYPDERVEEFPMHQMGGTRMAERPEEGIVDRNCKVHGQANLYVAGSSVFPSCGHVNPTLTIVQLSLRLADHLSS